MGNKKSWCQRDLSDILILIQRIRREIKMPNIIPLDRIESKIYLIKGKKVMLDSDLAALYGVETRVLNQAVGRNIKRFPDDFMFQFNKQELKNWRSQFVMSNSASKMGLRRPPYAFTEIGVAMLSSVLHSERAVQINIQIMRAFVKLRLYLEAHKAMARKLEEHDKNIKLIFRTLHDIMNPPVSSKKKEIGFRPN